MKWLTTSRNILNTKRTMVSTATTTNTGAQSDQQLDSEHDDDSNWMQSSQAESEEPSDQKVKGTYENVLLESSSTGSVSVGKGASNEEGYSADCSSDQQVEGESDDDSDGMQSCQADSEGPSNPKVTCSTEENVLLDSSSTTGSFCIRKIASSGEGYRSDCSACSDQTSDQSFYWAGSRQKQKSTMTVTWNLLDLKYKSAEMESRSRQGGSYLGETSASKAKGSRNTAKRSLSSCLKAKKNREATLSPGLYLSKQNRRHHCSNHHRRRSRPSPHARDRAQISANDLNPLLSDDSHKEPANTPIFVGTQALPQWKGVHFPHPMDPRHIYNSVVGHVQTPVPALATTVASLPATTTRKGSTGMKYEWRYR
jgi:hypothetical protein